MVQNEREQDREIGGFATRRVRLGIVAGRLLRIQHSWNLDSRRPMKVE